MKPLTPGIKVTLDRERHLIYDINANIAFEDSTGKTLIETMQQVAADARAAAKEGRPPKMPSTRTIRALLYAGLRSETLDADGNETEGTLTEHQIGAMLQFGELMDLIKMIGEAFSRSMEGLPSEPVTENPRKAPRQPLQKRRTGHGSGASLTNGVSVAASS
jgi:hypothetical protein